MPKITLFAYVDGSDLDSVAAAVETRLDALVAERKWELADVWVVNQRHPPEKPDGAAEWDLGVNLTLPAGRKRSPRWTEDVLSIAAACAALHRETGRRFVIGVHDSKSDATRDVFVVDSPTPDLERLASALASV
jgi:hypothetical protein